MTERRRPLDNDDGQESLFGSEAFAPAPWHGSTLGDGEVSRWEAADDGRASDGSARPIEARFAPAPFDSGFASFDADGDAGGPSIEDLAAYGYATGADTAAAPTLPTEVPAPDAGDELAALERATEAGDARRSRAPLAGPTLDDVMSRAWESLVAMAPAACPVCHGEVVPSSAGRVHGTCSSCGTTIE